MRTIRRLKQLKQEGQSLKDMAAAYSEISALKLEKIREGIQKNNKFIQDLSGLFYLVESEAKKREITPEVFKQGATHIIITSNYPFYGRLERSLLDYYLQHYEKFSPELRIVVGKTGAKFLDAVNFRESYESFILDTDLPTPQELNRLLSKIKDYRAILVYHSTFISVLSQKPTVTDVTKSTVPSPPSKKISYHIFEPEVEEMLRFFDNRIIQILLEGVFLESELARTAARLISMNEAEERAEDFIKKQDRLLKAAQKSSANLKALEVINTLRNWREKVYGRS